MPDSLKDVTVIIDIQRPTGRIGFGKPLILGSKSGGFDYKEYLDVESVKNDFAETTEEYKAAKAIFNQDKRPETIAITCRNSSKDAETFKDRLESVLGKDWYFLISTTTVKEDVMELADVIETDKYRIFFARTSSKIDAAEWKEKKFTRTAVLYHEDPSTYPESAWVGRTGSAPVGSVTWKFKTLKGIKPLDVKPTELKEIHDLHANTYVTKAGDDITSEGKVLSGEYIDIMHAKDYVQFSIEYAVQKLLNSTDKVSYTDGGIAQIESVVRTILQRAHNQGIIATDKDGIGIYGTDFKQRAEVDPADRAERVYNQGSFFFELAGAIHATKIHGVMKF
ncbi:DUF3383 family protein [Brevibacterium sp. JNUCC-42]|nr:DUF3383 family protein [Brevibacterium sp. JNUCC-42]